MMSDRAARGRPGNRHGDRDHETEPQTVLPGRIRRAAFASLPHVLRRAGIAAEEPIKVGNILDRTGILNIYSLKQIQATTMTVDGINAAGGLLGRPLELVFYDSQSDGQYNSSTSPRPWSGTSAWWCTAASPAPRAR